MLQNFPQASRQGDLRIAEPVELLAPCSRLHGRVRKGTETDLLERLLDVVAEAEQRLALQAERIRQLESLATTDELTGLLNRRGFERALQQCLAAATRHREPGLLLLCDVDAFKQVNDGHGHLAGDRVLCAVAQALRAGTRASDHIARIGGDEFAVLLPRTDPPLADRLAARLRSRLAGVTGVWDDTPITVSVSVGAEVLQPGDDLRRLLFRTDRALYKAKAGGSRRPQPAAG